MTFGAVYAVLLAALFVRVRTTADPAAPGPVWVMPGEPIRLVRLHHALFYLVLLGAPVEALALGSRPSGQVAGAALLAVGVVLYRTAGRALGASLSPLVEPRPGATLATTGLYGRVRHPMYAGQMLIAVGAPLTVGARVLLPVAMVAIAVLLRRIALEEAALRRTFPEFSRYATTTKRLVPGVY
ncbi:MAG: isoprenylcysteine carboxylmethyltransferase family protein [Candidatus Binatia bacterium]